jgi:hypothetical protein
VFNAIFSNISAISWRPVLVVEESGRPVGTLQHKYHKCETGKCQKQCNTIQQLLFRSQKLYSQTKQK